MTGPEAFALAKRKARYGHKPWIVWKDRNGNFHAEVETSSSVKRAMLDVGTRGHWTAIRGTTPFMQRWPLGVLYLRNAHVL